MSPIDRAELAELAKTHRLVPITRTLFADSETPVGVYRKLAGNRPGTFLLESAEPGASFSRWSFVGVRAVATLTSDAAGAAAGPARCRPAWNPPPVSRIRCGCWPMPGARSGLPGCPACRR